MDSGNTSDVTTLDGDIPGFAFFAFQMTLLP